MQNDIARKITTLASGGEPLSESEVSHFMTLSRKYLDHMPKEERTAYPILRFYCDWAVHITVDRSPEGLAILKRLNDTLVELAPVADNDLINKRITEIVSFRKLRGEIGQLFRQMQVPNPLEADQEKWITFAKHLIEIIRDCPLVFSEKVIRRDSDARELYESIAANPLKPGCWVVGLAVREVDNGQFSKDRTALICIEVKTRDTTCIVIPMAAREIFGPAI
jgi:hypothetical protein